MAMDHPIHFALKVKDPQAMSMTGVAEKSHNSLGNLT